MPAWGAGAGWQIISVRRLRSASARSPPMSRDGFPGSPGHVQAKATPQGPHSLVRRPRPWPINAVGCRRMIEGNEAVEQRLRERNEAVGSTTAPAITSLLAQPDEGNRVHARISEHGAPLRRDSLLLAWVSDGCFVSDHGRPGDVADLGGGHDRGPSRLQPARRNGPRASPLA